eukprot:868904-Pelagomonas_calceolata.AAC.1
MPRLDGLELDGYLLSALNVSAWREGGHRERRGASSQHTAERKAAARLHLTRPRSSYALAVCKAYIQQNRWTSRTAKGQDRARPGANVGGGGLVKQQDKAWVALPIIRMLSRASHHGKPCTCACSRTPQAQLVHQTGEGPALPTLVLLQKSPILQPGAADFAGMLLLPKMLPPRSRGPVPLQ